MSNVPCKKNKQKVTGSHSEYGESHSLSECTVPAWGFVWILKSPGITINVPVVYMAQDVMILMQANPFRGPLEGVGPGVETFLGPKISTILS